MAAEVFISYASENSDLATAIREDLEADGVSCWMASRDILGSADYIRVIPPAIESAKVFLLVLSARAMVSDHVYREAHTAADAKLPILPVKVDAAKLEGPLKFVLAGAQWIDATPRVEPALDRIRSEVRRLAGRPVTPDEEQRRWSSRFARTIATAVAWSIVATLTVLVALLIHGYWFNLVPRTMFPQLAAQHPVALGLVLATPVLAIVLQYMANRNLRRVLTLDALFALRQGPGPLIRTIAALVGGALLAIAIWLTPPTLTVTPNRSAIEQTNPPVERVHECSLEGDAFVESKVRYTARVRVGAYNPRVNAFRVTVQYSDPDSVDFCGIWTDRELNVKTDPLDPVPGVKLRERPPISFEIVNTEGRFVGSRFVRFSLIHSSSATLQGGISASASVALARHPAVESAPLAITEADWQ